jgi:hypothetical protein
MPINFPSNPTLNQVFDTGTFSFIWNGSSWVANGTPPSTDLTINAATSAGSYANAAFRHANAAYNQANTGGGGIDSTARAAAAAAQATADFTYNRVGFTGRTGVSRTSYQNIGSTWISDWHGSGSSGTFYRMPIGGGHNETDSPNQWLVSKRGQTLTGGWGELTLPYYSDDPRTFYKKWYNNSGRATWSPREEIYRSETVVQGNFDMIGQGSLVHGNNGSNWLDASIYFNGSTPNTTSSLTTQGSYLDPGTAGSTVVPNGAYVYFAINGQRARFTYNSNHVSGNIDVDDYGGNITEILNDTGNSVTYYYSYFAQGQDVDRTFVKVYQRNYQTQTFATLIGKDAMGHTWNYYWRPDDMAQILSPTGDINFGSTEFTQGRTYRLYWNGPAKTLPLNNRPYSFAAKFNINNTVRADQQLLQFSDAVNSTNQGFIFTINPSATNDRRVRVTVYNAAGALVAGLRIWQFSGNDPEDIFIYWSWNPADPVYPGRLYVNDKLVWCTATNPVPSLGYFGVGSNANGTANGFDGTLKLLTMQSESWGNHIPQGSVALDWDATTGLSSTTNNGEVSVDVAARAAIARKAYIRSSSTFTAGSYLNFSSGAPYSAAGSYTAVCTTVADDANVIFSGAVPGWIHPSGVYLITGTNVRTTRNVYASLTFGDKTFVMTAMDDNATATASGFATWTFTRINGGHYDAFYNTTALITQPGNATSLSKTNNSSQTLTNCLAGVNDSTYLAFGAFPNITFTAVAGSGDDDTLAGSGYVRTNTSSDTAVRNIQGMLGVGKKPSITGGGIPAVTGEINHTYVDGVDWDYYGRASHRVALNQAKSGNATASTYTMVYTPGNVSTFDGELDNTGGESSIVYDYNYSPLVSRTGNEVGNPPNNEEVEYGLGLVKSVRYAPPRGLYDSGIFRATAAGFFRRMYIGYGAMCVSIDYGSSPDLNRSTSSPTITYQTTAARANGLAISTSSGNYYRVVVIPLNSVINLS